ncbi:DUF1918 domain-containing protein [Actinacidiphila glaucinigra]|uniref:DUF1918 domain-containing protein n=1 Tax=Actinacidiphila glaucinigra TaxID=235986 RepID=UPI002E37759C|nr:DUF1918 domain-containing protein [Actinacidiphila glaucinigra]
MQATKGDTLRFTSRSVGSPEHRAKVLEVLGEHGEPPYRVRFTDGHEGEVIPGPDCVVEHPGSMEGGRTG